MIIEDNAHQK